MNQSDFRKRLNKLLAEEAKQPLCWWYLSYAKEDGFRGAVYIQAHGPTEATYLSRHRQISPGGEVFIVSVPDDKIPDEKYRNRLLTKEEVQAANPDDECRTLAEFEAEENNEQS